MDKVKMDKKATYVIITPVRDEEKYIGKTIESVVAQTILPVQWIIVNDGSKDSTGSIIDQYAEKYAWITTVHRPDRGFRKNGGGVVDTFYDGYAKINADFDFIVKLDADLSFAPEYFESCFLKFVKDPKLGIGGGDIVSIIEGKAVPEKNPRFHVRGATKIYKKACWDAIEYLIRAPGWDTLDEVKANMKGWVTYSFADLVLTQHKYTGAADGTWKNWFKNGRANYIAGYHPLFLLLRCIKRMTMKPFVVPGLALFLGYTTGFITGVPKIDDKPLIKYLRKEQVKKLILQKSIWN